MGARLIASLAAGALALGMATVPVAHAAEQGSRPVGKALVRIDGGTAHAKQKAEHRWRIVVPKRAAIRWLGEGRSGRSTIGDFTVRSLASGWERMGHASKAWATITWQRPATSRPGVALARLSAPRVNAEGHVVFTATTRRPLTEHMPGFTINIGRAQKQTRAYDLTFSRLDVTDSAGMQLVADSDSSATVNWVEQSSGSWSGCESMSLSSSIYAPFGTFTCGDVTFLASSGDEASLLSPVFMKRPTGVSQVTTEFVVQTTEDESAVMPYYWFLGSWLAQGVMQENAYASSG